MSIVGGLDIHRKQLTFDWVDEQNGKWERGRVAPADRVHLAGWLARFDGVGAVGFAMEGCTGWRYIAEEMDAVGVTAHLAEPADTRRCAAETAGEDRQGGSANLRRELLAAGRLPECCIPPTHSSSGGRCSSSTRICGPSTRLGERIQTVFFHQGATAPGQAGCDRGRARPGSERRRPRSCRSLGRLQVATALDVHGCACRAPRRVAAPAAVHRPRRQRRPGVDARHLRRRAIQCAGAVRVARRAGPVLVLPQGGPVCRAGHHRALLRRQTQPRPALSRQGPEVLRWPLFEAGKTSARPCAPGYSYYSAVKDR